MSVICVDKSRGYYLLWYGKSAKPMSAAEVTLSCLDNSDQQLDIDMAEVAITRRIYRTGESEFLSISDLVV